MRVTIGLEADLHASQEVGLHANILVGVLHASSDHDASNVAVERARSKPSDHSHYCDNDFPTSPDHAIHRRPNNIHDCHGHLHGTTSPERSRRFPHWHEQVLANSALQRELRLFFSFETSRPAYQVGSNYCQLSYCSIGIYPIYSGLTLSLHLHQY